MKSHLISTCLILASLTVSAQNSSEMKKVEKIETTENISGEHDKYLGREDKIKNIMKNGEIPASFPTFETGLSKEEYKLLVKDWLRANKPLIKEDEYTKFEHKL